MKHGGMAMVVTRVILAQLHQQLVAEKDVHATNVAWLRARTLVVPQDILSVLLGMTFLDPMFDFHMTTEPPTNDQRYPTGTRPLIPFANCGCRFQHPAPTTPKKERAVLAAHIERSGAQ